MFKFTNYAPQHLCFHQILMLLVIDNKKSPTCKHMIVRYPNFSFFSSQVLKHQRLSCYQIVHAHFQHLKLMGTTFEWEQVTEYLHQLHAHFQ